MAMRLNDDFGDHHPERNWYDYDEEVTEPKPPVEHNVGLKVTKRINHAIDLSFLDADIDLDVS